jgi:hypothetical protein
MQLHVEEKDVIYMYLIIAIFYTSFSLLPHVISTVNNAVTFSTELRGIYEEDDEDKQSKTKSQKKQSQIRLWLVLLRETVLIVLCVIAFILFIYVIAFLYLLATTDVKFTDNFKKTLSFIDTFLWRGGDLLPFYIPFAISAIVVFLVMSFYIAGSKSFVKDMAFASLTSISEEDANEEIDDNTDNLQEETTDLNDDAEETKSKNSNEDEDIDETNVTRLKIPGMDVSNSEMFRRYYTLMIMLIGLFMLMFLFIHFWDTDKATFAMYTSFLFILMICAIVSVKGGVWSIVFYLSLAACAAVNYYSVFKATSS